MLLTTHPDSPPCLPVWPCRYLFEERMLESLPDSIGGLVALTTLNLPHNSLVFLAWDTF